MEELLFSATQIPDLTANRFWFTGFSHLLKILIAMSQGLIIKQYLCHCTPQVLGLSEEVQGLN